jgi:hypothetical protein
MSIIFRNNTVCALCGKAIKNGEEIFSFPAFIQNTKDPFYQFNDASFHKLCLEENVLGKRAISYAQKFTHATRPENRICFIGKNLVHDFNDYIFIDMLTSNESEYLFKFNFLTIDKNNIRKWDERDEFLEAIVTLKNSEKWSDLDNFKYLDHLFYLISGKKIQ